jgi:hypothetical protein
MGTAHQVMDVKAGVDLSNPHVCSSRCSTRSRPPTISALVFPFHTIPGTDDRAHADQPNLDNRRFRTWSMRPSA